MKVENRMRSAQDHTELDRLLTLMTDLGQAVVIADAGGNICRFNSVAERVLGFRAGDVLGKGWAAVGLPVPQPLSSASQVQFRHSDGTLMTLQMAASPHCDHVVAVFQDRTKQENMAQSLADMDTRFRDLADTALDWFWETDADHRLIFLSQQIAAILSINPVAAVGQTFQQIGLHCCADSVRQYQTGLESRQPFHDQVFHAKPADGGEARTLRISGTPIFDSQHHFKGYRGVGVDITREIIAEVRAREVRQILEDSIASLADGVVVYNRDHKIVTCNQAYLDVLGADNVSQVAGLTLEQILRKFKSCFSFPNSDFDGWLKSRLELHANATGKPFIIHLSDGRWIMSRECRMAGGGVVGVRTDITEIKRRENEMETLKSRYQLILDSAGEGIIGLDNAGLITFGNQTAHSLLRYEPGTLVGLSFAHDIQLAELEGQSITSVYMDGVAQRVTNQVFKCYDGKAMPVDYFAAPKLQDDVISGAVVVFRDATLRQQYEQAMDTIQQDLERLVNERTQQLSREVAIRSRTEAALRESRARMKGITDCLLEGVLVVNGGGDIMFANPAAHTMICPDCPDEMEGLPMDQFLYLGHQVPTYFADSPWRAVVKGDGAVRNDDAIFTTSDGRQLTVAYACSQLVVEGGTLAAVILFRDIKELKDAQWDAMQASRLASVGQLAAGIAHEINTPTQYIGDNLRFIQDSFQSFHKVLEGVKLIAEQTGGTAQLQDLFQAEDIDYLIDELPSAITQSQQGVDQVRRIVLSMKEFSHPGSSDKVINNINRALESTLMVCRNTWKQVSEVETHFDPDLPQILCFASELNQVFLNLIINATHAIEEAGKPGLGRITITTRTSKDWLEVEVKDTGTGVPDAIRDRIFDPFFTTKPVGKGTGQGLAICRDVVVNKHGGRLDIESVSGEGATFTVRLPILVSEDAVVKDATG